MFETLLILTDIELKFNVFVAESGSYCVLRDILHGTVHNIIFKV